VTGSFSFDYTVVDDSGDTDSASTGTVSFDVTGVNDAPNVSDESLAPDEEMNNNTSINLTKNDSDPDDDITNATVTLDNISNDGDGNDSVLTIDGSGSFTNDSFTIIDNDSDNDDSGDDESHLDSLAPTFEATLSGSDLTLTSTGDDIDQLDANDTLEFSINYTVDDGSSNNNTASGTLDVTITGTNDQPELPNNASDPYTIADDTAETIGGSSGLIPEADIIDFDDGTNPNSDGKLVDNNNNIAVDSVTDGAANWQYKDGSGAWQDLGSEISGGGAFLLGTTDEIRLNGTSDGSEELQFHAWDQSNGLPSLTLDTNFSTSNSDDPYSSGSANIVPA
jgi:hypothetical protein